MMRRVLSNEKDPVGLTGRAEFFALRHGIASVHPHAKDCLYILVAAVSFALVGYKVFGQNWHQVQIPRICGMLFLLARRNGDIAVIGDRLGCLTHFVLLCISCFDHQLHHTAILIHTPGAVASDCDSDHRNADQGALDLTFMLLPPVFFLHVSNSLL